MNQGSFHIGRAERRKLEKRARTAQRSKQRGDVTYNLRSTLARASTDPCDQQTIDVLMVPGRRVVANLESGSGEYADFLTLTEINATYWTLGCHIERTCTGDKSAAHLYLSHARDVAVEAADALTSMAERMRDSGEFRPSASELEAFQTMLEELESLLNIINKGDLVRALESTDKLVCATIRKTHPELFTPESKAA